MLLSGFITGQGGTWVALIIECGEGMLQEGRVRGPPSDVTGNHGVGVSWGSFGSTERAFS